MSVKINRTALIRAREKAGHTQASLGRQSDVGQGYISQLELGKRNEVRPPTAKKLAEALGVDITDITFSDAESVTS